MKLAPKVGARSMGMRVYCLIELENSTSVFESTRFERREHRSDTGE